MNCAQWDWRDSSNSWKVVTNLFSLSIERLDELEMLEKVSWKSSNYLVWWRCLPSPLPPTRLKAARPAPGTWCIIVLVKKYPLYDRAMWSPTLHCMPDQVCAGCRSQIRKIFEFKIWKETMLVPKQIILQKKAFILSCFGLEEQRRGIDMGLPRPSCLKKYFYPRRPYTFCGEQALRPLDTATPLTIWLHKAEYQSFHLSYHLFLY